MALKTVLKSLLSKWGVLSIEMQKAVVKDQAVIDGIEEDAEFTYVDNEETHDDKAVDAVLVDKIKTAIKPEKDDKKDKVPKNLNEL